MVKCELCGKYTDVVHTCILCGRKVCPSCYWISMGVCKKCVPGREKEKFKV